MKHSSVLLLLLVVFLQRRTVFSFAIGFGRRRTSVRKALFSTSQSPASTTDVSTGTAASASPPSWEALSSSLGENQGIEDSSRQEPVVTLYRDTNGWCPFCERIWVALRVKQIPYRESLIPLQDKPQWYKDLVPTTLVPAVLFHQTSDDEQPKNERRIVWESMDILKALDEAFPHSPHLVWDTPEFENAMAQFDRVQSAGFAYQFSSRNDTVTEEERQVLRRDFLVQLDALDQAMSESGGPFRLGDEFSALDACMIPSMERWRYQLPITLDLDILDGRPHLQQWFDNLGTFAPYAHRVAGDEYSWTAVASTFLRYFGGGEDKPDVAAAIARADAAAEMLAQSFGNVESSEAKFALEAARKLVSNHEAVIQDCTRKEPLSQKHLPRASSEETAGAILRHVASILVDSSDDPVEAARSASLVGLEVESVTDAALAARTVAARLCVPRDMSGPAAKTLRAVLSITADRLEERQ